jgi:hypothetical protein
MCHLENMLLDCLQIETIMHLRIVLQLNSLINLVTFENVIFSIVLGNVPGNKRYHKSRP